jgi:beta-lactam-binding protein with PASTA domain
VPPPPVRRPPQPLGRAGSPTGPPSGRPPIAAEPGIDYRRPKRSRRGLYLLIGVLVAALLAGFTAWELGGHTTVPSVQGLSYADAKVKLEQAGLTIRRGAPEYTSSTGVPSGLILRTSPKPGDSVGDGNVVTVFVSLGPELSAVPSLSGQTLAAAISALTGARLQQGNVTERYSETAPAGTVIGSSPSAGSDQTLRTKVDLVVSKGRQPITIPDFTKKAGTTASTKLTALGFTVVMQQDFSDTVPTGMVISQTPNTGTGFKGDTITLTISKGVQLIEIPQLKRSTIGDATATLQGLGFVVVVHRSGYYVGANLVAGSDPPAGTLAPHGSTVTLTVV